MADLQKLTITIEVKDEQALGKIKSLTDKLSNLDNVIKKSGKGDVLGGLKGQLDTATAKSNKLSKSIYELGGNLKRLDSKKIEDTAKGLDKTSEATKKAAKETKNLVTEQQRADALTFGRSMSEVEAYEKRLHGLGNSMAKAMSGGDVGKQGNLSLQIQKADAQIDKLQKKAEATANAMSKVDAVRWARSLSDFEKADMLLDSATQKLIKLKAEGADPGKIKRAADEVTKYSEAIERLNAAKLREIIDGLEKTSEVAKEAKEQTEAVNEAMSKADALDLARSTSKLEAYEKKVNGLGEKLAQAFDKGNAGKQGDLTLQIQNADAKMESLRKQAEATANTMSRADTLKYVQSIKETDLLQMGLNSALDKVRRLKAEGADEGKLKAAIASVNKYAEALEKAEEEAKKLAEQTKEASQNAEWGKQATQTQVDDKGSAQRLKNELDDATKSADKLGQATKNAGNGSSLGKVANEANNAKSSLSRVADLVKKIGGGIIGISTAPVKGLKKEFDKLHGIVGKTLHNIIRIAKVRLYRGIVKGTIQGFKEGLQNAYQWATLMGHEFKGNMDRLATSTLYLKNSLAALAMPLYGPVSKAIDFIVDKFVAFLNVINQVIAKLTGATTWTRAVKYAKNYADSVTDAASAAKDLNEELITILGIDEINPMNAAKDKAPSGGSGNGDALDYGSMFTTEQVAIDQKLLDFFKPLEEAWNNRGKGVLDAFHNALESTKSLTETVGGSFWEVWTNGTGQASVEHLLGILEGILNTWGNLASSFERGWKTGDIGTKIVQNLWDILNKVLGMWEDIAQTTADWTANLNFEPALSAFNGLVEAIKPFADIITENIAWAWENMLLPLGKWTIEEGLPAALDAVGAAFQVIYDVLKPLQPIARAIWDEFLAPLGGFILDQITENLEKIKTGFEWIHTFLTTPIIGDNSLLTFLLDPLLDIITRLKYIKDFFTDLANGNFSNLGTDLEGVLFPRESEFWLQLHGEVVEVNDKVPASEKIFKGFTAWFEEKKASFSMKWEGFKAWFGEKYQTFGKKWEGFKAYFNEKYQTFGKKWEGFKAYFSEKYETFGKKWEGFKAYFKEKYQSFGMKWEGFKAYFKEKYETFGKKWEGFKAYFSEKYKTFSMKWEGFKAYFSEKYRTFSTKWEGFKAYFGEKYETFGKKWEGFKAYFNEKKETFGKKWEGFIAYFTDKKEGTGFSNIFDVFARFLGWLFGSNADTTVSSTWSISGTTNIPEKLKSGWEVVKEKVTSVPDKLKSGWEVLKEKVTSVPDKLKSGWELIQSKISNKPEALTSGWKINQNKVTNKPDTLSNIGWKIAQSKITNKPERLSGIGWKVDKDNVTNKPSKLTSGWNIGETTGKPTSVTTTWNIGNYSNAPNVSAKWRISDYINTPTITAKWNVSGIYYQGKNIATPMARGGAFFGGKWHNIPQYASGTLNAGSTFIAGERGPELVGHIGGRTEVLNKSQLASTMYESVSSANASQNRLLQEQNNLLRELITRQGSSRAYVTSGDIVDALTQRNRRDGRTVVPIGV